MNNKLKLFSTILIGAVANIAYAGSFYMGPSLYVANNQANNSSFRGLNPSLFFGYNTVWEDIYLAGELNFAPAMVTLEDNYPPGVLSAKDNRSYGASVISGFSINHAAMGYLRLGVVNTNFVGPNAYRKGAQFGLGIETALNRHWNIRGEYIYTTYKTVAGLGSVQSDQVGIGLVYKVI